MKFISYRGTQHIVHVAQRTSSGLGPRDCKPRLLLLRGKIPTISLNMNLRIIKVCGFRILSKLNGLDRFNIGTAHGFAARPNLELPEIKEAFELAFEQTVQWFQKTLVV